MDYIFVSYSRKQLYFAEAVALSLQRAGFEVWFDLQKLGPGVDWASALQDGYNNCEKLVFVASKAAVASPYVRVEWESALRNGREVIILLAEEVVLPEPLRACPVYDARTHFDRTIQSLIAYLRGEATARHDPVPSPGKFPFPLKMPFSIWFTIFVMALPAISVWMTTALFPVGGNAYLYALGIGIGLFLLTFSSGFALFRFWRHSIRYEEVNSGRWNLLWIQTATSLLCGFLLIISNAGPFARLTGLLILLFPLVTIYWSFRLLRRSADILRWFPAGDADQDMRETIQGQLVAEHEEAASMDSLTPDRKAISFAVHFHPADRALGERVASVFVQAGFKPAAESHANIHLIIITNRTSKQWLLERNSGLSGKLVYILCTNIETGPELQPVLKRQVVDFRMGRLKTIQALALRLANEQAEQVSYGMQVSPKGFSSYFSVPFAIWWVLSGFVLAASILILWGLRNLSQGGTIGLVLGLVLWFYFDLLMMRRIGLPAFFHKMTGSRFAWFASSGYPVKDPVGMDKKSRMRLARWALLLLMVINLDQTFQPPDPINNYSLEWEIDGTTYRSAGDTTYIMIDGTPVPYMVNGTHVATLEP